MDERIDPAPSGPPDSDRFRRLAYSGDDFPFYDGRPERISGAKWWIVMAGVVAGFVALTTPLPFYESPVGRFLPGILFFAIPLLVFALVTPRHGRAIFRRIRGRDILWMIAFALLNIAVALVVPGS